MKMTLKLTATLALVVAGLVTSTASAAVAPAFSRSPQSFVFSREPDFSRGMDASVIQPIESLNVIDMKNFFPNDLKASQSGTEIGGRIIDHSLSRFFNSDAVRNSDIGRTAHAVDKKMSGEMSVGGTEPDSVTHEFKFEMRASQARAQLQYSGITNAQLSYQAADQKLDLEIRESVDAIGTNVVFNHIAQNGEQRDVVSMQWVW